MSAQSIEQPYPIFTDADGDPLENGYIWIGVENLNPITDPVAVYWDSALTQPAVQPIRTQGGYPVNNGTPARLYTASSYSILAQDRNGITVYSAQSETALTSSDLVSFLQAGTGAVRRTAQAKMREVVSVKDFGAVGDGVTDDTAAIQKALDYAGSRTDPAVYGLQSPGTGSTSVFFPTGYYKVTSSLILKASTHIIGDGDPMTYAGARIVMTTSGQHMFVIQSTLAGASYTFDNIWLRSATDGAFTAGTALVFKPSTASSNSIYFRNVWFFQPEDYAIYLEGGDDIKIHGCTFDTGARNCLVFGGPSAACTNISVLGCTFYAIPLSIVLVVNVVGLLFSNNRIYKQSSPEVRIAKLFDIWNTLPTQAVNIVISNNEMYGVDQLLESKFGEVVITGNTANEGRFPFIRFPGSDAISGAVVIGNRFSGNFTGGAVVQSSVAQLVNSCVQGNTFIGNEGVASSPTGISLSAISGNNVINDNVFSGFTTDISITDPMANGFTAYKSTTGNAVNVGVVLAGLIQTYAMTVSGALLGDEVYVGPVSNTWVCPVGIDVRAYVSAASTVTVEYRNVTAGAIGVPAHDITVAVRRRKYLI
jgi:hypothetical protein